MTIARGWTTINVNYSNLVHRTLYSNEWTSDHLPRQLSIDTLGMKDHGASIGLPDQWQLHENNWIPLDERLQRWLFDVLCLSAYGVKASGLTGAPLGVAKSEWATYLDDGRCFTNNKGTDSHRDYINGTNTTADVMEWEPLVCGGNVVEVIGELQYFIKPYVNNPGYYLHYPIRCLDVRQPLPDPAAFLKDKAVCHVPTTIKPTGERGIFPQFNGRAVYPIWSKTGAVWVWERLIG